MATFILLLSQNCPIQLPHYVWETLSVYVLVVWLYTGGIRSVSDN